MTLLDTNAVLWLLAGHPRATPLRQSKHRLRLSPVSVLEIQFLIEVGRLMLVPGQTLASISADPRWLLDSPRSNALFDAALDVAWTRDPFDRLIVAHARCRRWRLATGDRNIGANLPPNAVWSL